MHTTASSLAACAMLFLISACGGDAPPTTPLASPEAEAPRGAALAPVESGPGLAPRGGDDYRTPRTVARIRAELDATAHSLWRKYDVRFDGRSIDVLVWMPHDAGYDPRATASTCRAVYRAVADATNERWARQNAIPVGRGRWHTYVLAGEHSGKCDYS